MELNCSYSCRVVQDSFHSGAALSMFISVLVQPFLLFHFQSAVMWLRVGKSAMT